MSPGDVVTCEECGASSRPLHTTGGRPFVEGGALIVSWDHGPYPRHEVAAVAAPVRCLWCSDRRLGFGPPVAVSPGTNHPQTSPQNPAPQRGQLALFG